MLLHTHTLLTIASILQACITQYCLCLEPSSFTIKVTIKPKCFLILSFDLGNSVFLNGIENIKRKKHQILFMIFNGYDFTNRLCV